LLFKIERYKREGERERERKGMVRDINIKRFLLDTFVLSDGNLGYEEGGDILYARSEINSEFHSIDEIISIHKRYCLT